MPEFDPAAIPAPCAHLVGGRLAPAAGMHTADLQDQSVLIDFGA